MKAITIAKPKSKIGLGILATMLETARAFRDSRQTQDPEVAAEALEFERELYARYNEAKAALKPAA
ncbi:hypothetical protein [Prosthecobacter sp.]|uniref:hypothetical protein n=1 Tax=Prosthecobacter sp. TaxID=1965333 RepID=UPI003782E378